SSDVCSSDLNWERIAEPEPVDQAEPEEAGPVEDGADRPARSATKAAWVAYAIARGMPETEAKAMTRDQLAARYRAPSAGLRPSGRGTRQTPEEDCPCPRSSLSATAVSPSGG